MRKLVHFIALLLLPALSRATTFYVSASGLDTNNGTSTGTPWQTIGKVNSSGAVAAGNTVLFNGGNSFSGSLLATLTSGVPTASTPVSISSYGTGQATINGGNSYAIRVVDPAFVTISNLNLVGSGVTLTGTYPTANCSTSSTESLLELISSSGTVYRAGTVVDSVTCSGAYSGIGTSSSAGSPTAVFDGLRISNCVVHDVASVAISMWGPFGLASNFTCNKNCRILDCQAYNSYGLTSVHSGSGYGIIIFGGTNCVIDRCVVHDCGIAQYTGAGNGTVGVEIAYCNKCTIRRSESYQDYSPQLVDGNTFDLDDSCFNCSVEYCYGHDSDGPLMQFFDDNSSGGSGSNSVHHSIFVHGGRVATSTHGWGLEVTGSGAGAPLIYNCLFYNSKTSGGLTGLAEASSGDTPVFYNNIFSIAGGADFGNFGTSTLIGNCYNVRAGSTFTMIAGGSSQFSLSGMQGNGFETLNGALYGAQGDPVYTSPGDTTVIMPFYPLSTFSAYDLGSGSAARGCGINVSISGINPPTYDWHRGDNGFGESASQSGLDAGPANYGSFANRNLGVP